MLFWILVGVVIMGLIAIWFAPNNINTIRVMREYVRLGFQWTWDKIVSAFRWIKGKAHR